MPTQYADIYVRDNFGDGGVIPSVGNPYASPDLIPLKKGTLTPAQAASTWPGPNDQGLDVVNPGQNNIYVRGKNLNQTQNSSGTAQLFYSPSSLFLTPNQWTPVTTADGAPNPPLVDQNNSPTIGPKAICLSNPPFLLQQMPSPAPGVHYCLIGAVQTPGNPVVMPPAPFPSNAALVLWVQSNPAVGWRNISLVPNQQTEFTVIHTFGNEDPQAEHYLFQCTGRNFQTGTPISVQCTDARCPIQQSGTLPAPDAGGDQIFSFVQLVPAGPHFSSSVIVTATSPGGKFPGNVQLHVELFQEPGLSNELHRRVVRPHRVGADFAGAKQGETAMLIKLGECTTRLAPAQAAGGGRPARDRVALPAPTAQVN